MSNDLLNFPNKQSSLFGISIEAKSETEIASVGIDPGKDGGVVVLIGNTVLERHVSPQYEEEYKARDREGNLKKDAKGRQVIGKRKHLDPEAYAKMIKDIYIRHPNAYYTIEKVRNIADVSSSTNFTFGFNFGFLQGVLISLGIKFKTIPPKDWQKMIIHSTDLVLDPNTKTKDQKKTSAKCALRIFKGVDFRATKRSTNPHDGIIDAALIAKAGYHINSI